MPFKFRSDLPDMLVAGHLLSQDRADEDLFGARAAWLLNGAVAVGAHAGATRNALFRGEPLERDLDPDFHYTPKGSAAGGS